MRWTAHSTLGALMIGLAALAYWSHLEPSDGRFRAASLTGEARPREWDGTAPEPLRASATFTRPSATGREIFLPAGSNLQDALEAAKSGDTLVLEAGATFVGPFVLPAKPDQDWIVIRSSALDNLPPGKRVQPRDAHAMAVLEADREAVLTAEAGAHHYWIAGVEIRPRADTFLSNLVLLGVNDPLDAQPHSIVFERCYLHGDPRRGTRRGIAMNSAATAVIDSYLADFKEVGADSQAVAGWNGRGPFAIVNSYLEAAGENIMFGGADPTIGGLVPADILIRGNHFAKPLMWRVGDPSYAGIPWTVKNLLELKNARRVLIDGNLFEYNWPHAQNGFAILFTVRNQDGGAPWSVVEDVMFTNNIVRHVASGINILGRDDLHTSQQTRRILIRNNLFYDVGGVWGSGRLFQLLEGTANVAIEHNTGLQTDNFVTAGDTIAHTGFVFRYNIVVHGPYGLIGTGTGVGLPTIERFFPDATIVGNAIVGGDARRYPPHNLFPASIDDVGFVSPAGNDYRLSDASPLRRAGPDGRSLGVDFDALLAAQSEAAR